MALAADSFLERMQLKSQVNRWRLLTIIAAALLLIVVLAPLDQSQSSLSLSPSNIIARIELKDVLFQNRDREKKLQEIANNDNIAAVILHVDSPGGTVVGGESLYYALQDIAAKKPLVAVMGQVAASGGYMVALPAHHIYAHEGTLTGSIGVMMQAAEFTELAEKIGVELITLKSGELKAAPSFIEKLTPKARQVLQETIQSSHDMFVRMVSHAREMDEKKVRELADGRIFTGAQALESGLVDALGREQDALLFLQEEKGIDYSLDIRDISLEPQKNKFEKLYGIFFEGEPLSQWMKNTNGLMALWRPAI